MMASRKRKEADERKRASVDVILYLEKKRGFMQSFTVA